MSAPVFLCPEAADAAVGSVLTLTGSEARHAATVQRRTVGERVDLVDGHGVRALGVITEVRLDELDVRIDGVVAATKQLSNMVAQQAYVMSFADVFMLLTILFAGLGVFALVMKKPAPLGGGAGGH